MAKPKQTRGPRPALTAIAGGRTTEHIESQPSVRAAIVWTPDAVQRVERLADTGDMLRLGDLIDQIMADDRFGELLETLVSLALGCPLSFEKSASEKLGDAEKAKELREDFAQGWTPENLLLFGMYKQLAGFVFARHEGWRTNKAGRMVPNFRTWHPKHFRYDTHDKVWKWRDERGNETAFTPGDGEWVAGYRRGPFRPWAHGLWRGLSRWWMLKQFAINDWGVHSEKSSKLVLEAGVDVEPEQRKALADDIVRAANNTIISLPVGFKLHLIEISASTRDIYEAQVQAAEEAGAIAILGQNLTTKVDGGSYAAAQEHTTKENRKVAYVAQGIGADLQRDSISYWALFNFGDDGLAPYPRYETAPPEDKNEKITALGSLAEALVNLQRVGLKLSAKAIEEDYGFKLDEMTEEEKRAVAGTLEPDDDEPEEPGSGAAARPRGEKKPVRKPKGKRARD